MVRSVFEIVKAPLGWSVFADNVKIAGVYDSRGAALEAAALAASFAVSDGVAVQINVPGEDEERPRWRRDDDPAGPGARGVTLAGYGR